MKTIKIIMLLSMFCLFGCSEEEPQSVSFLTKTFSTTADGESLSVSIEANCAWIITEESALVSVQPSSGSGTSSVRINVSANTSYDDLSHYVTIISEDGTSKDALTISQEKDYTVQAEGIDMISCEGGEFSIPVKTNDNINKVELPEWITFIESKSLTSYTYKFKAEPNKTGTLREGSVKLIGAKNEALFQVKQDSYAPSSVSFEFPEIIELSESPLTIPITVEPEYADISKLEIRTTGGSVSLKDEYLNVSIENEGTFSVSFIVNGTEVTRKEAMVIESFDADSIVVDIPDTLALSDTPYSFSYGLFPEYAKAELISIKSEGIESSISEKSISLTTTTEGKSIIKIYSSEKEIFSKVITVYDYSYPTSVEVEAPEAICKGRHSYKIKVLPENADISKLKVIGNHGSEVSIKGDSLIINVSADHFNPFAYFYSKNTLIGKKEFKLISEEAFFNIENGDIFVTGETVGIKPEIPLEYADIYVSDETVLRKTSNGEYKVIGEGTCSIVLTNKISKKQQWAFINCKKIHMYATLIESGPNLLDTYRIFEVYLKGFDLGPGELIFESGSNRIPVVKIDKTTHYPGYTKFTIKDGYDIFADKEIYKKYKLTYIGRIGDEYNTYVEEGDI